MCCPCGSAWSQKLSTCVRTKHPLSDCRFRKDETRLPIECTLVPGPTPNTFYMSAMGDSNLFHCSDQMVFDEEKCTCVRDENFTWPECPPNFLQFSDPPLISRAVSSSGPSLWTIWNDVDFNGGQSISTDAGDVETGVNVAEFGLDDDQYINLVFSAHGGYGRSGSLCFWSLLNGNNTNADLDNNEEALFTNCRPDAGANFSPDHVQDDNTLRISVERNDNQYPVAVNVYVRLYSDSSRNPWNFEEKSLSCALSNTEVDEWFQVCLIWSGQYNAIRLVCKSNDDSMDEDSAETSGFGIVASKSGLIEGNDLTEANGLDPLFGKLALVEFYKGCLPDGLCVIER
ncbi:hypothetical protein MAR_037853 [Mya arenaria]|uniref:Uncharacterized protein n=1 Tax=Mya arenaria TaxID=6604 RepID=A0ABY7FTL1_MYAAR|nr:hypothetical protein MAR_037853 [Mya arenaria]